MRFRRKKGGDEEFVSGEVVGDSSAWIPPEADVPEDTVDMEALAPETAAGGAARAEDDHGERTDDDSTTALEQATGEAPAEPDAEEQPAAVAAEDGDEGEKLSRKERKEREKAEKEAAAEAAAEAEREEARRREAEEIAAAEAEADRKAEEARRADEEAARAAEAEAKAAEDERRRAEEKAKAEAEAAARAREAAEEAAEAQRQAAADAARKREERTPAEPATSVSGVSVTSPGLGETASPAAAAAAHSTGFGDAPAEKTTSQTAPAPLEGPLAPILSNPAVQKKPELLLIGGLAAGFVVAKILKAITSDE